MGRVLLILAIASGIIYGFQRLSRRFIENSPLGKARRRFAFALRKFSDLSEDYDIDNTQRYYLMEAERLSRCHHSPVIYYKTFADEIEEYLKNPAASFARKVYDPVDNSLLQKNAVEVVCDHPTAGRIYVAVNRWNVDRVSEIFARERGYYATSRFYQIRTGQELGLTTMVIHQDNGATLTNALLINHLLTERHVSVHDHHYHDDESGSGDAY